jgi:hypothetical protein
MSIVMLLCVVRSTLPRVIKGLSYPHPHSQVVQKIIFSVMFNVFSLYNTT